MGGSVHFAQYQLSMAVSIEFDASSSLGYLPKKFLFCLSVASLLDFGIHTFKMNFLPRLIKEP